MVVTEKNFTIRTATPHVHADHARRETLRTLMGPAPCWPDGTPRWKEPPKLEAPEKGNG